MRKLHIYKGDFAHHNNITYRFWGPLTQSHHDYAEDNLRNILKNGNEDK